MPLFVYLTTRRYFVDWYSLMAPAVVIMGFYFTFHSSLGRVDIAWGFLAGLVWAAIGGRRKLLVLFALLLTVSHYGTVYLALFAFSLTLVGLLINFATTKKDLIKFEIKIALLVVVVLLVSTSVWYGIVTAGTGGLVKEVVTRALTMAAVPGSQTYYPNIIEQESMKEEEVAERKAEYETDSNLDNFLKLESRDAVVQSAFGMTWPYMNAVQRIELVSSWLVVIFITAGLLMSIRKGHLTHTHLYLSVAFYAFILVSIVVPYISFAYGVVRMYFTALVVLSSCFIWPVVTLKFKRVTMPLSIIILVVYGLCTSGIMHSLFGILKVGKYG